MCKWNAIGVGIARDVKVKMVSTDRSFLCAGCGDTERMKKSKGRRKVNAHSSERVFTLLKSIITCELERNGSENNLLFVFKSLVPQQFATFLTANKNSTCFAMCVSNNCEGIRTLRHQIRNLNNA